MPKSINKSLDEQAAGILIQIKNLRSLLEQKYMQINSTQNEHSSDLSRSMEAIHLNHSFDKAIKPLDTVRALLNTNIKALDPKPLDLDALNTLKSQMMTKLFSDKSQRQTTDFPDAEQEPDHPIFRKILLFIDSLLSWITNYSLFEHYFPYPKTKIELTWDALDDSLNEYVHKYKYESVLNELYSTKICKKTLLEATDVTDVILSYLEPEQLVEIERDKNLRVFFNLDEWITTKLPLLRQKGFKDNLFLEINPLRLFDEHLATLLKEGFHYSIFRIINPERFIQTPLFNVKNMPKTSDTAFNNQAWWENRSLGEGENFLPPEIFPNQHRVIRGRCSEGPFISVLNSDNQAITFFHGNGFHDFHRSLLTYDNKKQELAIPHRAHMSKYNLHKEGIESCPGDFIQQVHDQEERVEVKPSLVEYEAWMTLFLGYINESCLQNDGSSCNMKILAELTESLKQVQEDNHPFVDRDAYPNVAFSQ